MKEVELIAEEYFDTNIGPLLRESGVDEYPIERLRERYIEDILDNEAAILELKEWKNG